MLAASSRFVTLGLLRRGAGTARESPWLKAASPKLPVDCATLLTTCCPGPPRSCGRRQRSARLDHGFDRSTVAVSGPCLPPARHTIDNYTLCQHHQTPLGHHVNSLESPHTTATFGRDWPEPVAPIPCPRIYSQRPEPPAFRISLYPLPPAARNTSTHVHVNSPDHAAATAGAVRSPLT